MSDFGNNKVSFVRFNHHLAHAANACFTSPFDEAACMIVDGQGEWGSISYYAYQGSRLRELHRVKGEESLGILYSVCTELCGFNVEKGEEWKLMGLAPYGKLDQEILADFQITSQDRRSLDQVLAAAADRGLVRPDEKARACHERFDLSKSQTSPARPNTFTPR